MTPDETDPTSRAFRSTGAGWPPARPPSCSGPARGRCSADGFCCCTMSAGSAGYDRRVVLEVMTYEAPYRGRTVASGFGPRSDGYRNLHAQPKSVVQFGNRHHTVAARRLCAHLGLLIPYRQRGSHHPVRTARAISPGTDPASGEERPRGRHLVSRLHTA
jgi:hypothetical protein